jgi:hypothetical protein
MNEQHLSRRSVRHWPRKARRRFERVMAGLRVDTITRYAGSWAGDGFSVGDLVTISGGMDGANVGKVRSLSGSVMTIGT